MSPEVCICGCQSPGGTVTQCHFIKISLGLFQYKQVMWILIPNLPKNVPVIEFSKENRSPHPQPHPFYLGLRSQWDRKAPLPKLIEDWDFFQLTHWKYHFFSFAAPFKFPWFNLPPIMGHWLCFLSLCRPIKTQVLGLLVSTESQVNLCFPIMAGLQDFLLFFFLLRCVCKDVCKCFIQKF